MSIIVMSEHKYKNTLRNFEASFEPQDWKAMQAKLQAAAPIPSAKPRIFPLAIFERKNLKYAAVWLLVLFSFGAASTWLWDTANQSTLAESYPKEEFIKSESSQHSTAKQQHHSEKTTTNYNNDSHNSSSAENGNSTIANSTLSTDKNTTQVFDNQLANTSQHETGKESIAENTLLSSNANDLQNTINTLSLLSDIQRDELSFISSNQENEKLVIAQNEAMKANQFNRKGEIIGKVGTGLVYSTQTEMQSPMVMASVDVRVGKNISTGAFIGWNKSSLKEHGVSKDKQSLNLGMRSTYHIPVTNRLEVYAGLQAGVELNMDKNSTRHYDVVRDPNAFALDSSAGSAGEFHENNFSAGPVAGISYKLKGKVGAYLETSPGLTLVQAGVQVQIR